MGQRGDRGRFTERTDRRGVCSCRLSASGRPGLSDLWLYALFSEPHTSVHPIMGVSEGILGRAVV